MPLTVEVADAVVTLLNGNSFSQPFTAERLYLPVFELPEMKILHVTVVPKGMTVSQSSRSSTTHDVHVDIAVQKKFDTGDAAELDPLMQLAEEIADFFRFKTLPGPLSAAWIKTEHAMLYAQEHMNQLRQFTSVLTLTFRVIR